MVRSINRKHRPTIGKGRREGDASAPVKRYTYARHRKQDAGRRHTGHRPQTELNIWMNAIFYFIYYYYGVQWTGPHTHTHSHTRDSYKWPVFSFVGGFCAATRKQRGEVAINPQTLIFSCCQPQIVAALMRCSSHLPITQPDGATGRCLPL